MPSNTPCPFHLFSNANLGTQYDYIAFTGEWFISKGIGQYSVLPSINAATGNVILKSTLVKTQEKIGDFELGFVYNAQNPNPWTDNIPEIITSNASQLTMREADGSLVTYTWDATQNAYVSPAGGHSRLLISKQSNNSFIQTDPKTGKRTTYDADGKITAVYDARGFCMQYHYDAQNKLQTITSPAGAYTISNTATTTTVSFIETGKTQSETLGTWNFDSNQRLVSAVLPTENNYTLNYAYAGSTNQLACVSQTDGTSLNFNYTNDNPAKIKTVQSGNA